MATAVTSSEAKTDDPAPILKPPVLGEAPRVVRQYELAERVKAYAPHSDDAQLNAAYVYAMLKHGSQKRASGEPYYAHPVAVAAILADLKLDQTSVIAALLHDTVEDTEATIDEIADLFGDDVARLVEGVTKLSEFERSSREVKQAENFQKFILSSVQDIRVLLVKLADRLHNMRTLHFIKKAEKRHRIANETMDVYAPLARRVGMYKIAAELEDLAFHILNPDAYSALQYRIKEIRESSAKDLERVDNDLKTLLADSGVEGRVIGRQKQPYSIWRKLKKKDISFRDVADIFAYRMILTSVDDCYKMLGVIHQKWGCLQERFRDYVSMPKPNGYRSIHTTVRAAGNRRIELQIRTEDMDATAERGVAAHWSYKNSVYGFDADSALEAGLDPAANLTAFADMLRDGADAREFYEHAKLEMYLDHVFAFTPKGRLIVLPKGAMPLDFAYAVHTKVGDSASGCRINGEVRPMRTELNNGDVVEIIRDEKANVLPGWEALTRTGRAKSAVRRLIRLRENADFLALGTKQLEAALNGFSLSTDQVDLESVASRIGYESRTDMLTAIGRRDCDTGAVLKEAFPALAEKLEHADNAIRLDEATAGQLIDIRDLPSGAAMTLCEDCSPVLGDRIVGVQKRGEPITVHAIDCNRLGDEDVVLANWVDLRWTGQPLGASVALGRVKVTAYHKPGVLAQLCTAIADCQGNITGLQTGDRSVDFIDLLFDIEVRDIRHLTQIITTLDAFAVVDHAERIRK